MTYKHLTKEQIRKLKIELATKLTDAGELKLFLHYLPKGEGFEEFAKITSRILINSKGANTLALTNEEGETILINNFIKDGELPYFNNTAKALRAFDKILAWIRG